MFTKVERKKVFYFRAIFESRENDDLLFLIIEE